MPGGRQIARIPSAAKIFDVMTFVFVGRRHALPPMAMKARGLAPCVSVGLRRNNPTLTHGATRRPVFSRVSMSGKAKRMILSRTSTGRLEACATRKKILAGRGPQNSDAELLHPELQCGTFYSQPRRRALWP